MRLRTFGLLALSLSIVTATAQADTDRQSPPPFNDVPQEFTAKVFEQNFIKRVEMIPMRDGVKLHTLIFIPKGAKDAPMLMGRTPYNAARYESSMQADQFLRQGFIRVYQDIRGKYGSEGNYVVTMPVRGPLNPTSTDHVTDTWDTVDWLVKNVSESNGRVAIIGNSYDGFTAAMALLDPHPALKAAVPVGPLLDAWMGDDWFHYGAFRQMMLGYVHMQTGQRGEGVIAPSEIYDKYEEFLRAGSVAGYAASNGLDKLPFVQRLLEHPAYDAFWQGMAVDKLIVQRPSKVPTLWTQGLWDQEDMWGSNHVWRALQAAGHEANNWLVLGPWNHIQPWGGGTSIGPMKWPTDTSYQWTNEMLLPFLNEHLRNGPPANLPRVTVYNTGEKRWDKFTTWPTACDRGCGTKLQPLYLTPDFSLSFEQAAQASGGDTYTSDPATPVPFLPRPVVDPFGEFGATGGLGSAYEPWSKWLSTDQRFVAGRPDVLVYETEVLTEAVRVQGIPIADIRASTTGTDGDFVVKLIDVYPSKDYSNPGASGYQLPIATDIFRGRYRESFEHPTAIPANKPQQYRFELPNVNHVFQPGHRIMVQIQSTLFPLYDRNPQTFVANIFKARPTDYKKAEVTILRSKAQPTAILLPVVK
ncbi:CocE/NonD family hydrolase [Peristeroidobacter soli]|uniref:CocE/NonD family hydrolase n=1 Tax=Peristeroidobacter soli TaxID=2497877 RepID=UPI00101B6BE2|nr:CocE/NonD family hydrolase [Peristeroidobacter soli]